MNSLTQHPYWRLMRLDKPIGIYLLLWPTLWALLLASDGLPPMRILLVFIAGVVLMRSAGCVINDYADRHFDGAVARTQHRPLARKEVTPRQALGLFLVLVFTAFLLVLLLNWQTIALSVGGLILAAIYPFMKRYTHYPQVVLGAAFGWAIPMAAMAVLETLPPWVWWLYLANLLWTVAYDTQYAMVDREDDLKIGVKSTAIAFGGLDNLIIALLQAGTLGLLVFVQVLLGLSWPFTLALMAVAGLFIYQQGLTRARSGAGCFRAFLNNHYVGLAITVGITGHFVNQTL